MSASAYRDWEEGILVENDMSGFGGIDDVDNRVKDQPRGREPMAVYHLNPP